METCDRRDDRNSPELTAFFWVATRNFSPPISRGAMRDLNLFAVRVAAFVRSVVVRGHREIQFVRDACLFCSTDGRQHIGGSGRIACFDHVV